MHGYCRYYLTIKLQTSAWLACNFFVNNNVASSRGLSRFPGTFDLGLGQMKKQWDLRDF